MLLITPKIENLQIFIIVHFQDHTRLFPLTVIIGNMEYYYKQRDLGLFWNASECR